MKKIFNLFAIASLLLAAGCDLDLLSPTSITRAANEIEDNQYTTRADMEGLRNSIYNSWCKDIQEKGHLDYLVYSECHADNAYCGNPGTSEILTVESNNQDPENYNLTRDWNWYLGQVSNANQIICNIDAIKEKDASMTQAEHDRWKAEAYCWRAFNLHRMCELWGDVPLVTVIPPVITSENIEDVYDLYYPPRTPIADVYDQMIQDLEYAVQHVPDPDPSNKFVFSKGFAAGMLARIYAEAPRRDWNKVAQYCRSVEDMGYSLVDDYGQMWAYTLGDDGDAVRNTSESIFEVQWSRSSGNWLFMMYHRNAYNPDDSYTWIKWVTPSRDLIAAYDAEGDTQRKNAGIIFDQCSWSQYYPSSSYAFMHKVPTNASSILLMRLGEIYLLHAEALAMTDDFAGAAEYVNRIRRRAGLGNLPASASANRDAMVDAILKERRLELAFEGFRFFDLVRHGKAIEVCNAVPQTDSYWQKRFPMSEETMLMPVPQEAMNQNPNLVQNPGY